MSPEGPGVVTGVVVWILGREGPATYGSQVLVEILADLLDLPQGRWVVPVAEVSDFDLRGMSVLYLMLFGCLFV